METLGHFVTFGNLQTWLDAVNGSNASHYPIGQDGENTLSYAQLLDDAEEAAAFKNSLQGITVPERFTALARSLIPARIQTPHSWRQTTMDDIWAALAIGVYKNHTNDSAQAL
jgi:hypothetical protein